MKRRTNTAYALNNDGGARISGHHPEHVRNDIAAFVKAEAESVKEIRPDLFVVLNALAKEIGTMPCHPIPEEAREVTVSFVGPSGAGKSSAARVFTYFLRSRGYKVRMTEEPTTLTISDGTAKIGYRLAMLANELQAEQRE